MYTSFVVAYAGILDGKFGPCKVVEDLLIMSAKFIADINSRSTQPHGTHVRYHVRKRFQLAFGKSDQSAHQVLIDSNVRHDVEG